MVYDWLEAFDSFVRRSINFVYDGMVGVRVRYGGDSFAHWHNLVRGETACIWAWDSRASVLAHSEDQGKILTMESQLTILQMDDKAQISPI
jgi:hypothetical protein